MKNTEAQIVQIGMQVMNDIDWSYDKNKKARAVFTSSEEQYEKYKKFADFEKYKHNVFAYWTVVFDFTEEWGWQGRNIMWVLIKDETGEAYEVGHRQAKFKLIKDTIGKYKKEP